MLVKGNYVPIHEVTFVTEEYNLEKTLEVLEVTGYRCIPVLDKAHKKFLGNIYKTDILIKESKSLLKIPATSLLRDTEKVIKESSSFFDVFFAIKSLPFIVVINEREEFIGILTQTKVIELLEDAWGTKSGSYTLTIGTIDYQGALLKLIEVINKYSSIQSLITLDSSSTFLRRLVVTLSKDTDNIRMQQVTLDLEKNGFRVVHVEKQD